MSCKCVTSQTHAKEIVLISTVVKVGIDQTEANLLLGYFAVASQLPDILRHHGSLIKSVKTCNIPVILKVSSEIYTF